MKNLFRSSKYYPTLLICSVAYAALTLLGPLAKNNTYKLSVIAIHMIQVSFIVLILLIWVAAVYGAVRFKQYADSIKKSGDGAGFSMVANGLIVLAFGLVATSLVGTLRQTAIDNGNEAGFTIINNYMSLLIALVAFALIYGGSAKLLAITNKKNAGQTIKIASFVIISSIAILFTRQLLKDSYRNFSPDSTKHASYFMSDVMIIATIVIPSVISWTLGAWAAINIWAYRQYVKGFIYKSALSWLVKGIVYVVSFSILIRLITLLSSLSSRSLAFILVFVYVLLATYAIGFLLIAVGSRQLAKIDEL